MSVMKYVTFGIIGVCLLLGVILYQNIIEVNDSTNYQITQGVLSGKLSVVDEPGPYGQWFDSVTTYPRAGEFSPNKSCFLEGENKDGLEVSFRDGSRACIDFTVTYENPTTVEERIALHRLLKNNANVTRFIEKNTYGALTQTANLYGAEETYSTKRSDFIQNFRQQLIEGVYATESNGQVNDIRLDEYGKPIIAKPSAFTEYGFRLINIEVTQIDFDSVTDELIASRKAAEQNETLARANAQKAIQDTLTITEQGKADVARARFAALKVKEEQVINAQRETAIQVEKTKQAAEDAKQRKLKGDAEAYANAQKVEAGLTPQEEMEYLNKRYIGMAEQLRHAPVPQLMIVSGSGEGGTGAENALEIVGAERAMRLIERLTTMSTQ